ncbi:MAG: hypothetical protein JO269_02055 [Burkholderiaceae bacterium]|nr:hypothetical protein [Burkholderiaceae bacterium]
MAIQFGGGSRDSSKNSGKSGDSGFNSKVAAPKGRPNIAKRPTQGITGKLDNGSSAMNGAGAMKKGGPIKSIASQPIVGQNGNQTSAMGGDDIIKGVI